MTSKLTLAILLLFVASLVSAQEHIWTNQTKISEIITFEKAINPSAKFLSENVLLSKEYYPLMDKYEVTNNPVIVQREPLTYLPVYAEYFYTPQDSVVRLISYDWEKDRYGNFFDKQKMWKEESYKLDIYNSEYERIRKDLLSQLGAPTAADTSPKKVDSDGQKYFSRETLWENGSFKAKLNMIFANTTYRIRLTLYWKE